MSRSSPRPGRSSAACPPTTSCPRCAGRAWWTRPGSWPGRWPGTRGSSTSRRASACPRLSMDLKGRTAIVTGGSRGLGQAIARHFLDAGASVPPVARDETRLAEAKRELATGGGGERLHVLAGDVVREDTCAAIVARAQELFGALTILVNNAGVYGPMGRFEDVPWPEWEDAVRINLFGTALMCRAAIPAMRARGVREDHQPLRRRRHRAPAAHQRLRGGQGGGGAPDGDAGPRAGRGPHRCERHRAGSLEHAIAGAGDGGRPGIWPRATVRRRGPRSPTRCAWPTNSSRLRGRIRAARGWRSGGGWKSGSVSRPWLPARARHRPVYGRNAPRPATFRAGRRSSEGAAPEAQT